MSDVRRRIAALSPEQRAVLEKRLAEQVAQAAPAAGSRITARDRSGQAPLAIQQQREWTFSHYRSANNIPGAFRVEGDLDPDVVSEVLTEVVARHEVLRSTVEVRDGEPVQVVHPPAPVPVPVIDLSDLPGEEQTAQLRRRWNAEVETPFDADAPQRLRISLLRLAERTHVVLIAADHAAADLVSVGIMMQEFAALYGSRGAATGEALAPLPIQYGDYAAWQRQLEQQRIASELAHWRETLAGIPAELALPTDRPYPVRPTFAGATHIADLPAELTAQLREFGQRESASLGVVLTAAASVLLYRYTGRDDLVIGEIVSGRNRAELQPLIGCFVGALPMRLRLHDEQSLRELVRHTRQVAVTAYDRQDLPVDGLLDRLDLGSNLSLASLIDLWLDVRTPAATLTVPGLRISPEPVESGLAPTPLTLDADPNADQLRLHWIYMTELFDADTVRLLAEQFERILRELVSAPQTAVGQVPLSAATVATTAELAGPAPVAAGTATGGTAGAVAGGNETTIVELFGRRLALAPHASAAVHGGVATSYTALNRDANRLAHQLRERGVGPDTPVAILADRTPRLAVAILGVLKSGGYYVPVDPAYPADRIVGMLADSGARVLVTESGLVGLVEPPSGGTLLVDQLTGPDHDPPDLPDPGSLAYTVYTSGSTGRPKGAMIEHGSLATYARDVAERLGLGAGDRFLQFASPSFDVLAEELFPTWVAGGCVVFPDRPLGGDPDALTDLIDRQRLTVIELPTAYWHEWVRALDRQDQTLPECLRLVIIGGERALPERLATWRRFGVPLMNCYGLTETTVTSTFFLVDPRDPAAAQAAWPNLPIGTPLPSADLRLLDHRLRPVPVGGTGELYLGGRSVGRGYLGRPGLTAHRFIADPDPSRPGQRLYRTGDLIRQRADGTLEFISRVDRQVKIRGFRVEPSEVESVLSRHPGVAETAVSVYEPAPGDRRLVAYVVPAATGAASGSELRRYLADQLPAYLVPSSFVELAELPLTPSGKVDRNRLPAPSQATPAAAGPYAAPQSPVQRQLAEIVAAVVGVDRVGLDDNFFEIGGDSILAIQVVARAQEVGLRLSPLDLFAHPTVAALAKVASAGPVVDAEQADVSGPVPLTPQQRWFATAGIADPHHWNRSALLDLPAEVDSAHLTEAVERLMIHHDGLRQRLLLAGERTRVRIAPRGDPTPLAEHDLAGLSEAAQRQRIAELGAELQTRLDPAVGPLVRFALVRCGPDRPARLAIVAHRLVADARSLDILTEDLRALLAQAAAGQTLTLPPKTTSWQAWARRLRDYAATPAVQSQRGYWSDLLTAAAGRLPEQQPVASTDDTEAAAATITATLRADQTAELLAAADPLNCRIEELLLAALGRGLTGCSGAEQHLVGFERDGRYAWSPEIDVSRTVGWFSHSHPVRLVSRLDQPPETTLKAVKEALRTVPAAGIGWQLLRTGPDPLPDAEIPLRFRYLGQLDPAAVAPATEPAGPETSPRARRPYPVEVDTWLVDGALAVSCRYHRDRHQAATAQSLVDGFLAGLREFTQAARQPTQPMYTPSDFPLAGVDQAQLDNLLSRF